MKIGNYELSDDVLKILKELGNPNPQFVLYEPRDGQFAQDAANQEEDRPRIVQDTRMPATLKPRGFLTVAFNRRRGNEDKARALATGAVLQLSDHLRTMARAIPPDFSAAAVSDTKYKNNPEKLVKELPKTLIVGEEIGVSSLIPGTDKHIFFADLDDKPLKQVAWLDGYYRIIKTSERVEYSAHARHVHLIGPVMTWAQCLRTWDDMLKLRVIDPSWPKHQKRAGYACLRLSSNVKKFLPEFICTVEELQNCRFLELL